MILQPQYENIHNISIFFVINTNNLLQYITYISIGQNYKGKHREHEKEQHFFLMSRNEAVNENMMCRVKPFDIF